jgi:hypothetical protein
MELLLNLAWLLLALPAYWLWRASKGQPAPNRRTSLQCLLALGCMLVVLFPVISATDDLRAMRTEMEESPVSKRSIRQASSEKPLGWKWQSPQLVQASAFFVTNNEAWHVAPIASSLTMPVPAVERTGRAPPRFVLG